MNGCPIWQFTRLLSYKKIKEDTIPLSAQPRYDYTLINSFHTHVSEHLMHCSWCTVRNANARLHILHGLLVIEHRSEYL